MIDPIFQSDGNYQLARRLLDAASMRQEAIAANIANSETPGYHRVDVNADFASQLKASYEAGEISNADEMVKPSIVEDKAAHSVRPDGNNVEVEQELLAMNKNSVEYTYLTDVVTYNMKQLKMAIGGQVSSS